MSPSVRRPGESEPFRDADPGARARRRELLSRRRDDLATMPHAVRGVYVRRFARIGAALAASVVGSLLVAATNSAAVEAALADLGPPPVPAVLLTCLAGAWLAGIVAYLLARCYAEHRFSLRMASAVLPTEDLYGDVERLSHVWPHRVARLMAHRLERPAAAVPVLAAGLVGPLSALYLLEAATSRGYPDPNWFEYLAGDAGPLWLFLACVGAASAALLHLRGPTRSAVTGVAVAGLCSAAAVAVGSRCWPMALVPATAAARLSATTRRERERIDSSELRVEPFDLLDLLAVAALARAAARSAWAGIVLVARADYPGLARRSLAGLRTYRREAAVLGLLAGLGAAALLAAPPVMRATARPAAAASAARPDARPRVVAASLAEPPGAALPTVLGSSGDSPSGLSGIVRTVVLEPADFPHQGGPFHENWPPAQASIGTLALTPFAGPPGAGEGLSGTVRVSLLAVDGRTATDGDRVYLQDDRGRAGLITRGADETTWHFDCGDRLPEEFEVDSRGDAPASRVTVRIEASLRLVTCR